MPIFTKNIDIYVWPLEFFEKENFDAHAPMRAARMPKLWIWTSKIMPDLWLLDVFCPIKKNSTLHPSAQPCFAYGIAGYTRTTCDIKEAASGGNYPANRSFLLIRTTFLLLPVSLDLAKWRATSEFVFPVKISTSVSLQKRFYQLGTRTTSIYALPCNSATSARAKCY